MNNQEQIIGEQGVGRPMMEKPPVASASAEQLLVFRGFFAQFKGAWQLFVSNFLRFFGLMLISIFVPIILLALIVFLPMISLFFPGAVGGPWLKYLMFLSGVTGFIIGLAAFLISFVGFIALFILISQEKEGKIGQSLKMGLRFFFRFLGGWILIGLMVSLGSVFLLVPGMILALIFSFWPFIVIKENVKALSAIKKCFQLVRGHFWIICLRYLAFFIITAIVNLIFVLLLFILWPIGFGAVVAGFLIYLIIVSFLINVLSLIFVYVIYKDVSEQKRVDPKAKYKLSVKEKILLIVLMILFLASFLFSIFKERQLTVRPQIIPEEELMHQFLKEQGVKIELPSLENVPLDPWLEKAREEGKPVTIIRDEQRISDFKQIKNALEAYFEDHGEYPTARGALGQNLICLVSYFNKPESSGFITSAQLAENPNLCENADKIYISSFPLPPPIPYEPAVNNVYSYDSLCSKECLLGEKNNFYALGVLMESESESDLGNFKMGFNCLTSEGLKAGNCVSQEIVDTDEDDLNDFREIYIYKTDRFNPDTDGDGYLDGAEVRRGYNPNGPGRLSE